MSSIRIRINNKRLDWFLKVIFSFSVMRIISTQNSRIMSISLYLLLKLKSRLLISIITIMQNIMKPLLYYIRKSKYSIAASGLSKYITPNSRVSSKGKTL
jgi:hypothetical protein